MAIGTRRRSGHGGPVSARAPPNRSMREARGQAGTLESAPKSFQGSKSAYRMSNSFIGAYMHPRPLLPIDSFGWFMRLFLRRSKLVGVNSQERNRYDVPGVHQPSGSRRSSPRGL